MAKPYKDLTASEKAELEAELPAFVEQRKQNEFSRENLIQQHITELRKCVSENTKYLLCVSSQ